MIPLTAWWAFFIQAQSPSTPAFGATVLSSASGGINSCYVDSTNAAYCWGWGGYGANGDGTSTFRSSPTLVTGGHLWSSISVGTNHTCAIKTNGSAYCWGAGSNGEMGDGTTTANSFSPVLVSGGYTWASIEAGYNYTCGVTTTNVGYCWGYNNVGQLGNGNTTSQSSPTLVSGSHSFTKISLSPNIETSASGYAHTCGRRTDGLVYCWGAGGYGQLGNSGTTNSSTPVATTGSLVFSSVSVGTYMSCAILTSNSYAYCWGNNPTGSVGDGTTTNRTSPTVVSGTNAFTSISAGPRTTCGIAAAGTAYCWGEGNYGQQGDGTAVNRLTPTATTTGYAWSQLEMGIVSTCGVTTGNLLYCWGGSTYAQGSGDGTTTTRYLPHAVAFGASRYMFTTPTFSGSETLSWVTLYVERVGDSTPAVSVNYATSNGTATAGTHYTSTSGTLNFSSGQTLQAITVNIANDGSVNADRTFNVTLSSPSGGTSLESPGQSTATMTIIDDDGAKPVISRGKDVSCYITSTSAGNAYCMGYNGNGAIGDGTTTDRNVPTLVTGALQFRSISVGWDHVCGIISSANQMYCWGNNNKGQLGLDSGGTSAYPTLVKGNLNWASVEAGYQSTCGVTTDGKAFCWGYNSSGQLGDGSNIDHSVPWGVFDTGTWRSISPSPSNVSTASFTCGVKTTNIVSCWGSNTFGQLGDGTTTNSSIPVAAGAGTYTKVSTGRDQACATLTTTNVTYCWGANTSGEVGDGTTTNRSSPTVVSGSLALTSISLGGSADDGTSCGLTAGGVAYCWGGGGYGAQGDGTDSPHWTPTSTMASYTWTQIDVGAYGACGLTTGSLYYCWGSGAYGQLGDGNTLTRYQPRSVSLGAGRWAFSSSVYSVNEATATITITVERQGATTGSANVNYATSNGTATAGTDYTSTSGTLNFVAADATKTFNVTVNNDALSNGNRTFNVTLSSPSGGTSIISPSSAVVTILDDDSARPQVARGANFGCYITTTAGGDAYCWGYNAYGTVGDASTTNRTSPTLVAGGLKFRSIAAGNYHACGIAVGTNQLYCWGYNIRGQLGIDSTSNATSPTLVKGNLNWTQVELGYESSCGVTANSYAFCWGYNNSSQIGDGTTASRSVPSGIYTTYSWTFISTNPQTSISASTCGLRTNGNVLCWGGNAGGQLGDGTTNNSSIPVSVGSGVYNSVAVGRDQACATLTSGGSTYCWGGNSTGQVGNGTTSTSQSSPTATTGPIALASVSLGGSAGVGSIDSTSCGLTSSGASYCWGSGGFGLQGDGTAATHLNPTAVMTAYTWAQLDLGSQGACGVTTSNLIYCWGYGTYGANGDGGTQYRYQPRQVQYGQSRFTFASAVHSMNEATATITITVERQGSTTPAVSVNYATSNGTATAGTDYTSASGTLNFAATDMTKTFNVTVNNDALSNGNRTFNATLSSPSGGTALDTQSATSTVVTILDDESAKPQTTRGMNVNCYITTTAGGDAYCSGLNTASAIGDGTATNRTVPTLVSGGLKFRSITSGYEHVCGIVVGTDQLYCWGRNSSGQSAQINGGGLVTTPTLVTLPISWAQVDAGYSNTCGVASNGLGFCWGVNGSGQLGDGTIVSRNFPTGILTTDTWTMISPQAQSTIAAYACGLKTNGNVMCWGSNIGMQLGDGTTNNSSIPIAAGSGVYSSLAVGRTHVCATLTSTGVPYCWGENTYGQIGDGTVTQRGTPTATSGAVALVSLSAGALAGNDGVTCGLTSGGTAYCWGGGVYGAQGDGSNSPHWTPTSTMPDFTWAQLNVGTQGACGVTTSGLIYCWGYNFDGQIGDGTTAYRYVPRNVQVGQSRYAFNSSAYSLNESSATVTVTVERLGSTSGTVSVNYATSNGTAIAGTDYTSTSGTMTFTPGVTSNTFNVTVNNDATANGRRAFNVALSSPSGGTALELQSTATVTILDDDSAHPQVAAGQQNACYIDSDAGGNAYCWGDNTYGIVGDTSNTLRTTPTAVSGGLKFSKISVGFDTACGITVGTNQLYCWGRNSSGQIGNDVTTNSNVPVLTFGSISWSDITLGYRRACGLSTAGKVFCWGANQANEFGSGTLASRTVPVGALSNDTFRSISLAGHGAPSVLGAQHACAITTSDVGYCWGKNTDGQLGNTGTSQGTTPQLITGGYSWLTIEVMANATCGITTGGATYCWGYGTDGQIGDGNTNNPNTSPVAVTGSNTFRALAGGRTHECAITTANDGYCWGDNTKGEIGDGTTVTPQPTPTAIGGSLKWRQLDGGEQFTCGVTMGNAIYCWGLNATNQLGNGLTTDLYSPNSLVAQSVSVSIDAASVTEGNSGTVNLQIPLTLSGTTAAPVVVTYSTSDGTALSASDYTAVTNGSKSITAGQTSATISISVNGDTTYEPDETLTVTITGVSYNAGLTTSSATGTILNDDDFLPSFTFTLAGVTAGTACNGVTSTQATSPTAFSLHPTASTASSAVLGASVNTNGNGYSLYVRYQSQLVNGAAHNFADHSGTNTAPTSSFPTGTEAFGYTTDDSTLSNVGLGPNRFLGPAWAGLTTSYVEVGSSSSPGVESTCQAYQSTASPTTPAGSYSGTITYMAVPNF